MAQSVAKQLSSKVWNTTIKIPELKTPMPAFASLFDSDHVVTLMTDLLQQHKGNVLVVTGAGVSTDSGIPDYRGDQGTYVRNPKHRPILYHELAASHDYRQRYWSRSYLGWSKMAAALPNASHDTLASLVKDGFVQSIITQNVDHLHSKAGTPDDRLLELHGTLFRVECMDCGDESTDRTQYQHRIHARNPSWQELIGKGKINPDGDVELPAGASYSDFDVPPCSCCGSVKMKPKVVFFGENVKPQTTERAEKFVRDASAVLVIGSSLATYSAFRLLRLAHQLDKPIGIVSKGPTRADSLMSWKGEVGCTPVLQQVYSNLNKLK